MGKPANENPEWRAVDFARAKPAAQVLGEVAASALVRKQGNPAIPQRSPML
jgi:hypothetical protein